jgi:hypothetical protein
MNAHTTSRTELELIRCSTKTELRRARQFRHEVFRAKRGMDLDSLQERRRDESSHVMLLTQRGTPCATARAQSYPGSGKLAEIAPELSTFGADSEVGRIAALSAADGLRHSVLLLVLGAMWLVEHTGHRRYVAYCHPKLVPLYQLVGATDAGLTIEVDGRPGYRVVLGDYSACVENGLRQLVHAGFSQQEAVASVRWRGGRSSDNYGVTESVS